MGEAKRGRLVFSPARLLVPFAAGGPLGLGCEGDQRVYARRCRLCPSVSRLEFPGSAGEAAAVVQPWNKSLRSCPRFIGVCSGAGEGAVRVELADLRDLADARFFSNLGGSAVGCCSSALSSGTIRVSSGWCRLAAGALVVVWWVDLCFFFVARRRCVQVYGQRGVGCVPGRCSYMVILFRGSLSKPLCDGTFSGYGALAVPFLLRRCLRRRWRWAATMEMGDGYEQRIQEAE